MGKQREAHWLVGSLLAAWLVYSSAALAADRSDLSRWLGDVVTPQLRELLSQHPRYQGQSLQLSRADHNGLAAAVVTVLKINLRGREGISLVSSVPATAASTVVPARIDDLQCAVFEAQNLRLLVSATEIEGRKGQVFIALVEPGETDGSPHSWEWRGSFTRAERETFRKTLEPGFADGSVAAPWSGQDMEPAASGLHRQLACALRPQVETRLGLEWSGSAHLPPLFADTVHRSRHLLGNYAELGFTEDAPDYRITTELTPFRENVWQLWLTGLPQRADLAPVQAVAYFRSDEPFAGGRPSHSGVNDIAVSPPGPVRGPVLDYLEVEMLDAWLGNERGGSAELQVQLRLENRSDWPIDYSFSVSGGHYQHCIPEPAQYRHDRYGRLAGRLEPGQSLVRPIVIKGTKHRPNPWFGPRKCAGFRSLEGFEDYPGMGGSVTEYVRWGI
jgi:hypothetical protein